MTSGTFPETVHIRIMQADDLEQVQAIDELSFSMPWPASAFRYELYENPMSLLWVAEVATPSKKQKIAGFIVLWMIMDEAHIATLAVHPDYRELGIARRLLVTALAEAIHRGLRLATLEVRANNTVAQKLYRRFRFKVVGSRPRYYRVNNEDALIMTVDGLDQNYLDWLESGDWAKNQENKNV